MLSNTPCSASAFLSADNRILVSVPFASPHSACAQKLLTPPCWMRILTTACSFELVSHTGPCPSSHPPAVFSTKVTQSALYEPAALVGVLSGKLCAILPPAFRFSHEIEDYFAVV